jgi:hypothetical protein
LRLEERRQDDVFLRPHVSSLKPITSSECAGSARDRAKVEDLVRFQARTLEEGLRLEA